MGTFAAKVHLVDNASSYMGKFRVLLVPDGPWPSQKILRLGIHSRANIRLSDSYILKEIWRQLTGFPPVMEPFQDELKQMLTEEKGKDK
jgi:adhesin transport system membrane fusion protein